MWEFLSMDLLVRRAVECIIHLVPVRSPILVRQQAAQEWEFLHHRKSHRVKGLISQGLITFGYLFGVFLIQTISIYWISFVSYCQSKGYPKAI
jgi:hypothetical protein